MKRSSGLKTRKPLKRTGFKNKGSSLKSRSPKKDDSEYQFNSTFKKKPSSFKSGIGSSLKSGGQLKQKTPLKAKREEPRRKAPERVQQERIAPKAGEKPNTLEKIHMNRVSLMVCLVCKMPSTVHHVTGYADKIGRITRSHKCVVPLCQKHHQKVYDPIDSDPVSVEGLGHRKFFEKHGLDLYAIGCQLWEETLKKMKIDKDDPRAQ